MPICLITYDALKENEEKYSQKGLHLLSKRLDHLQDFPYTAEEQITQAQHLASKLSIQGVQPKLSIVLDVTHKTFAITDKGGTFILKPQNMLWPYLPENEDLTMHLAKVGGLEVPLHGLIYCKDGRMSYWIRRFDRPYLKKHLVHKIAVEDFAQLSGENRQTKYQSSMEKVVKVIEQFTTFPLLEKEKLFNLTLFNFLVGNEDMHLKNFSLICINGQVMLSPCYDLVNTTLALGKAAKEELALPLQGKKSKLTPTDFFEAFGRNILGLQPKVILMVKQRLKKNIPLWEFLIKKSFLPKEYQEFYLSLVLERYKRLGLM
jgi:serine/threonine-protein kinase HipA